MSSARSSAAASSAIVRRRERPVGQRRAPRAAVVEGGQAVAVGEPVELGLPRLGGVAEAGDQQDVGSVAPALGPELGAVGVDRFAHLQFSRVASRERSTWEATRSV